MTFEKNENEATNMQNLKFIHTDGRNNRDTLICQSFFFTFFFLMCVGIVVQTSDQTSETK